MRESNQKSSATLLSDLRLAARLWPFMAQDFWALLGTLVLYLSNAACIVAPPYLLQQMLDGAVRHRDVRLLYILCAAYLGALLLEYVSGFFSEYIMSLLGQRAMAKLRAKMFAHVQHLPTSFFDFNPSGRLQTRLTNDIEALGEIFATGVISMFSDLLSVVGITAMMIYLSVKLSLATFLVVPVLVGVAMGFQRYARRAFEKIRRMLSRINSFLAEHIGAIGMVQAMGQEERTRKEFAELNAIYRDANHDAIFADAALYAIVEAIGTMAISVLLYFGARDLGQGAISAGVLVAFMQYIRRFFAPIRDLSTKYTVLQSAFTAAERVFDLLDTHIDLPERKDPRRIAGFEHNIELADVCFSYARAQAEVRAATERERSDVRGQTFRPTLEDISFTLTRGHSIGLVGTTGSGKSTLLKLLNRTYDIEAGSVRIDGVDVRDYVLRDVRRLFAVVQQDVALFSGTVLDNLCIAERVTKDDALAALDLVGARRWAEALPQGLDTELKARGQNFSAGERQVLALARAVATGADIILMDEATSNIDSQTEAQIQHALDRLLQQRSAIIVAHRLSTLARVDRILVLEHGRLIEQGSHAELLAQGGRYAEFVAESTRSSHAET